MGLTRWLIWILLGLTLETSAWAQVVDPLPEVALRDNPEWITGRLPNGVTWYARQNREPRKRAYLRLIVNAGSTLETEGQRGLAHFVEHMCFNGTESYSGNDLIAFLQSMGTDFGADLNAYTSFDETVYELEIRTDSAGLLDKGLQVLQEWAFKVKFDPEEIDKERGVILEEKRLRSNAGRRISEMTFPVLYAGSRYPDRFPIGTEEVIAKSPYDTLIQYYRDWYRPDLIAVVAVGDFDLQPVIERIQQLFGQLKPHPKPRNRALFPVPPHSEPRAVVATDPEQTLTIVSMHLKRTPMLLRSDRDLRRSFAVELISSMFNTRLSEVVHAPQSPLVRGYQYSYPGLRTVYTHQFVAIAKEGRSAEALQVLVREYERMRRHGFLESELARARQELLSSVERSHNERDKVPSRSLSYQPINHYLRANVMLSPEDRLIYARQMLPEITVEEIQQLIRNWMGPENRVFVLEAPEKQKANLPTAEEILQLVQAVEGESILPYVDADADLKLVTAVPQSGKVVERQFDATSGVHQWKLSNGASVWLKPTDFKNDEILFEAWAAGGLSTVPEAQLKSAILADYLVEQTGIGQLSSPQLEKVLQGREASLTPEIDELSAGFSGRAAPKDLETLLQLLHLYVTAPRNDAEAVRLARDQYYELVRNSADNPQRVFSDSLSLALASYHPRARPTTPDDILALDTAVAFQAYRTQYRRAQDFTFVLVGNIDTAVFRPLAERWIATLPTGSSIEWKDNGIRPPKGKRIVTVKKGIEPKSMVRMVYTGTATFSPEARAHLSLLADYLNDRLMKNLREEQGGVYTVGVSAVLNKIPYEHFRLTVSFGCAPENVDRLRESVEAEIRHLIDQGVDDDLFNQRKTIALGRIEKGQRENQAWLRWLLTSRQEDRPLPNPDQFLKMYRDVKPKDLRAAARQYLDQANRLDAVLYPEGS